MRLIDADALGLDINRKANENFPANRNLTLYAESLLAHAPTIDAVPVVHGRWVQVIGHVEFEDGFVDRLYECCSRCHEPNGRKTSDYCPNCGCRMDGGNE